MAYYNCFQVLQMFIGFTKKGDEICLTVVQVQPAEKEINFQLYYTLLSALESNLRFTIAAKKQTVISILCCMSVFTNFMQEPIYYKLNSSGPNTVPWGTPCFGSPQSETLPSSAHCCSLSLTKLSMHSISEWEKFSVFNFPWRISCDEESEALDELKKNCLDQFAFFYFMTKCFNKLKNSILWLDPNPKPKLKWCNDSHNFNRRCYLSMYYSLDDFREWCGNWNRMIFCCV